VGQCEGQVLKKCVSNQVISIDCSLTGKVCSFVPGSGVFDCVAECLANCAGKECGDDGCGGECGVCQKGFACLAGACVESIEPCTAACSGKVCGDDGCGGSCGECPEGMTCENGTCAESTGPGDGDVVESDGGGDVSDDGGKKKTKSGGCSAAPAGGSRGLPLLLVLALAFALLRTLAAPRRPAGWSQEECAR